MKNLPSYKDITVLVAGDVMLDRYWNGSAERISPEAPVPVVLVEGFEERPGGAGNVARSITALGGQCSLAALLGEDESGEQLERLLLQENVSLCCVKEQAAKTVTKLRVVSRNQQLIRLDFESNFTKEAVRSLTDIVCGELERHDALILSDYKKGSLENISEIIEKSNAEDISVFIDPKGNDFSRYKNATVITPNQAEFTAIVGDVANEQELAERGMQLLTELKLTALIITRSEKGVTLIEKSGDIVNIPARAKEVFDVTGAGDTFISVLAASYAAKSTFEDAVNIANAAASVVVGKLGAATVSKEEIESELYRSSQMFSKIIAEQELIERVNHLRAEGKKIVMTNGCFDILHSGHVEYLLKAKELGDVLIVAVNSDDSVTQIKGETRPINKLQDRMTVLSGLQSVDWLVSFNQDTPLDLIQKILPDVLVKGGDYTVEEIVGNDIVKESGGEVTIIDYVDSYSTSNLISKINSQD